MPFKRVYVKSVSDERINDVIPTVNGASYSPSDMRRMTLAGSPVSTAVYDSFFYDGTPDSSEVLPEDKRGVDVVEMWDLSKSAKKKIRNAHTSELEIYGQ